VVKSKCSLCGKYSAILIVPERMYLTVNGELEKSDRKVSVCCGCFWVWAEKNIPKSEPKCIPVTA